MFMFSGGLVLVFQPDDGLFTGSDSSLETVNNITFQSNAKKQI